MAENENGENAPTEAPEQAAEAAQDTQVQVGFLAQYVKDLSFENPNAPASLQKLSETQPAIDVSVNLNAQAAGEDVFEVDLKINVTAKQGQDTAFIVELLYSGLFGIKNMPQESLQPFLFIECPRMLFPFARRVISDATRDGGFPPLMLEPIDFASLYMQQMEQQKNEPKAENPTVN